LCNAAALTRFNVPVINSLTDSFNTTVENWLNGAAPKKLQLTHSTYQIVQYAVETARQLMPANKKAGNRPLKEFA